MAEEKEMENEDVVEDESYNLVWTLEKEEPESGDAKSDHGDQPLCFWNIDPSFIPRLQKGPEAPVFFPFPDPLDPKNPRVMMLTETRWSELRVTVKNKKGTNWARKAHENRGLQVINKNGDVDDYTEFVEKTVKDPSPFWVDTFDKAFLDGQERAHGDWAKTIDKPWIRVEGVEWKLRTGGSWRRGGADQREFEDRKDGVGFMLEGWRGGAPNTTDRYVKLHPSDVERLLQGDPQARARGVSANQVYIPEGVMTQLRKGEYPFGARNSSVALLNAAGDVGYITCNKEWSTSGQWWEDAYWSGVIPRTEWKVARSRNVSGLTLCFVVNPATTKIEVLEAAVNQAKADAILRIDQTAIVVDKRPDQYNILVSRVHRPVLVVATATRRIVKLTPHGNGSSAHLPSATTRRGSQTWTTRYTSKHTLATASQGQIR
jgi:hypothetical protein